MDFPSVFSILLALFTLLCPLSQAKFNVQGPIRKGQRVSICFADCSSCSFTARECQTCYAPFFFRDQSGNCNISRTNGIENYRLQSSAEEERSINFLPSPAWFINGENVTTNICNPSPNNFSSPIYITGPYTNEQLNYRRTISLHNYFSIKMMLILINWCSNCSIKISLINEDAQLLGSVIIDETWIEDKARSKEQLCSNSFVDYRLSVSFQIEEQSSRQLLLRFQPNVQAGSSWAISTFLLITGKCNKNCATCEGFSPNLANCKICKNFFSSNSQIPCSGCNVGFKMSEKKDKCQKCPIQFQSCDPTVPQPPITCYYNDKPIDNKTCAFLPFPATYFDDQYAVSKQFFGSLFTIEGKGSSVFTCGDYSMIGLANKGDIIKRTFLTLPPHTQISVSANIFVVDQENQIQKYTFLVFLDGQRIDQLTKNVLMLGTSNECEQNNKVQAFQTFGPTKFYPHFKTNNIVIGIGGDSLGNMLWGIRDIRIAYRGCDSKCLKCTQNGCQVCPSFLILRNYQCLDCIAGMGFFSGSCNFCKQNCKRCSNNNSCEECFIGFYLYQLDIGNNQCRKNPNYRSPQLGNDGWKKTLKQPLPPTPASVQNCTVVGFQGELNNSVTAYNFIVAQDRMIKQFDLNQNHFKVKIEFILMKIDEWNPNDVLHIYANDLLVRQLKFSSFGNRICGNQNQTEFIRFQEILLEDDNQTMTIEFEVVHEGQIQNRAFGVANFKIYPISCSQCQNQPFNYKVEYTIDNKINVLMEFNRIYRNNDPQKFKKIFKLDINGNITNQYDIVFNDSIRYWLSYGGQTKQVVEKPLKVICLYPEEVITDIQNADEDNNDLFVERLLQQNAIDPEYTKTLDNRQSEVQLIRFTPLSDRFDQLSGLKTFFDIITRIVIYAGFASFFIGCQTGCTHVMHSFQKIWIHIYVAALAINPILKYSLLGFRQSQNQNIAINPETWESSLPDPLYYDVPAPYELYYEDITFFRNIYSIGVACLILIVVYIVGFFIFRNRVVAEESYVMKHLKITFCLTKYFYWNSVIFYQYFTVVLACCLQFLDLRSRLFDTSVFAGINAAASIIAFILATAYPIFHFIYLRKKKKIIIDETEIDEKNKIAGHSVFKNKYAQIFFRFMKLQYAYISDSRFLYNVFRFGELWWIAIVAILVNNSPFSQAFLLMLLNAFHFFFILFSSFNRNKIFRFLKAFELLFFVGIEILILVMHVLVDTLTAQSYETLGIVGIVFLFVIITLSFVRMAYIWYKIVEEYKNSENSYRRNLMFYDEDRLGSEIQFD